VRNARVLVGDGGRERVIHLRERGVQNRNRLS
jgi:hypothetical protein